MVTLNRRNLLRFDAAPTEVQMKLGISQVLSLPFAYNAPVIVLDFEVGNKNIIKGRFKDASRPRVFEFEIGDSVSFKPFTWKRTDSDVDPMAWEDFSKGYTYRYDAVKKVRKEKPKCGNTSYNCGKACISLKKNCKSDPPDKPSQEKIDKVRAMGGEFKQTKSDPTKAQENNKLTPKPPEEVIEPYNRNNAPSKSTPDSDIAKRVIADIEKVKSGQVLLNEKERYRLQYDRGMYLLNDPKLSARQGGTSKKLTEKEATDFLSEQYEKRAKRLVKEIAQGKSRNINIDEISSMIDGGKQTKPTPNSTGESGKAITKSESKPTPNSTRESGKAIAVSTPDKKVEQKYKDIIASSKDPKGTEKVLREAMVGGALWKSQKQTYKESLEEIEGGIVPEGYENHVQGIVDRYKPVIDAENFINKRREAVAKGDFRTKEEAELYVGKKIQSKSNKPYDYFDSPEYGKEYEKIKSVMKSDKLPPPLSGVVPSKELKQTIKQGDQLLYKKDAYSLGANSLSGYEISDAGEVVDIGFKNVKTRSNSEYMGRLYENEGTVPLDKISHIIRDGKRYKVDPSDSSPNDLGIPEAKTVKGAKGAIAKSETPPKTPKTSKPKVVDPLSLTPKPSKTTPKLIGDGTHEGTPKNAQEYYDAAARSGKAMTMKEAEDTVAAVSSWSVSSNAIRNDQKKGKFNKKAEIISDYVRNSTPYKGDIHRGIVFKNREEAMEWIKGDENGVLDNQNAHASWSSKESVAWVYTNPMMRKANKTLVGVIVSSVNKTGVSIEKLSRYKESEAEVLVPKDAKHKVKSVTEKNGIIYVETEEVTDTKVQAKKPESPINIGDGTHEGMPKNAQEYYDMVTKSGGKITKEEAEGTIKAIEKWGLDSNYVRDVQKAGKSSQAEQYITDYINNSTPYKGELYRGLSIYTENPLDFIKVGQLLDNEGAHASWTSKPEVAEWFADEPDDYRYSVVIKSINNKTGASIRNITEEWQGGFMGMEEVIVPKNAKHIVRSIKEIKKDVFFVEVEEV